MKYNVCGPLTYFAENLVFFLKTMQNVKRFQHVFHGKKHCSHMGKHLK